MRPTHPHGIRCTPTLPLPVRTTGRGRDRRGGVPPPGLRRGPPGPARPCLLHRSGPRPRRPRGRGSYVTLAVAQDVAAALALFAPTRRHRTVGLALTVAVGVATFVVAVLTMRAGQDPDVVFDGVAPAGFPTLAPGSHVAVLSVIVGVAAASIAWLQPAAPREQAGSEAMAPDAQQPS